MIPAASTPPAPIPEERDPVAPLPDEPAADAVLAGRMPEGLAVWLDGAGVPVVAGEAGLAAEDGVEDEEEADVAPTDGLAPVTPVAGFVAALGDGAGLPLPTTGGPPVGVAGTDPGAPLPATGLADDEADAAPVTVAAAGVLASAFLTSSFFAGVGPVDAAEAALP